MISNKSLTKILKSFGFIIAIVGVIAAVYVCAGIYKINQKFPWLIFISIIFPSLISSTILIAISRILSMVSEIWQREVAIRAAIPSPVLVTGNSDACNNSCSKCGKPISDTNTSGICITCATEN